MEEVNRKEWGKGEAQYRGENHNQGWSSKHNFVRLWMSCVMRKILA